MIPVYRVQTQMNRSLNIAVVRTNPNMKLNKPVHFLFKDKSCLTKRNTKKDLALPKIQFVALVFDSEEK